MVVAAPPRMSLDEFYRKHGGETHVELIDGQVVRYPMAGARHGLVNMNAGIEFATFVRANRLGRVMSNDTFVRITDERCRGADVCYLSFAKLPAGQTPDGILEIPPELVLEVRSPTDLWTDVLGKVIDYIGAGVQVVVVLDPKTESASVFRSETRQDTFEKDQTLTIPDVLPGFSVPVSRFFEE